MKINKSAGIAVALMLAAFAIPAEAATCGSTDDCVDADLTINEVAGHVIIAELMETSQVDNDGRVLNTDLGGSDVTLRLYTFDRNGEDDSGDGATDDLMDVYLTAPSSGDSEGVGYGDAACPDASGLDSDDLLSPGTPVDVGGVDGISYTPYLAGLSSSSMVGTYCFTVVDPTNAVAAAVTTDQSDRGDLEQFTFVVFNALDIIIDTCDTAGANCGPNEPLCTSSCDSFGVVDFGAEYPGATNVESTNVLRVGNLQTSDFQVEMTWSDLCFTVACTGIDKVPIANNLDVTETITGHSTPGALGATGCAANDLTSSTHVGGTVSTDDAAFYSFCILDLNVASIDNDILQDGDFTGTITVALISTVGGSSSHPANDWNVDTDCFVDPTETLSCYNGKLPNRDADGSLSLTGDQAHFYCDDAPGTEAALFATGTDCFSSMPDADLLETDVDGLPTITGLPSTAS